MFEQTFPDGANLTALGPAQETMNLVISSWPAFDVAQQGQPLGYLAYSGPMVGSNAVSGAETDVLAAQSRCIVLIAIILQYRPYLSDSDHLACGAFVHLVSSGLWNSQASMPSGTSGAGPLVLFTESANASLILSAFNNFMAHSTLYESQTLSFGLLGSITTVPVGYTLETILFAGTGVNAAMLGWGDVLLAHYGKERHAYKRDFTLRNLGYSTDNGAFYYYKFAFAPHVYVTICLHKLI